MSIIKCIWTKLEKNLDHRGDKPATNRLRCVMIQLVIYFVNLLVYTRAETQINPNMLTHAVIFLTCSLEVQGSNLAQDRDYPY